MAVSASSVQETYDQLYKKLERVVPAAELKIKAELVFEINRLKREKSTVILGHNYMEPTLFVGVPDFTGDSLELSRIAASTSADTIIFCGVRFMAETAKILNPTKTVLLPAKKAGCSLAESISAADIRKLKADYPGIPVVAYINTYADAKAEIDICCTSGNARRVVESLNADTIIFLPDEYLAGNVARETGRHIVYTGPGQARLDLSSVPTPRIIGWRGRCEVHEKFSLSDVSAIRSQFPGVMVLAHPECSPAVVEASDYSASTSQMVKWVREKNAPCFSLLTECSMADNIIAENPDREIVRMCSQRCQHMNEITLEDVLLALRENVQQIELPADLISRARGPIDKMLSVP